MVTDRPTPPPESSAIESQTLAATVARLADNKKGADIRVLALAPQSGIADYFVLVTGQSRPQVKAITEEIHVRLKALGAHHGKIEGAEMGWWVLLDFGDVIVHVMQPEAREYYDLDGLYGDSLELDWSAIAIPELEVARRAL
jgi:ribosome-associated protein